MNAVLMYLTSTLKALSLIILYKVNDDNVLIVLPSSLTKE